MDRKVRNSLEISEATCKKINPICDPLVQVFGIQTFGYRKFFPDGTCFNTSSNFDWTKFVQEKFNNTMIPNYEDEVRCALRNEKHFTIRFGEPDPQDIHLSTLYDCDVWNTLSLYRKNGDSIEGFYFTSKRCNYKIIKEYIHNMELFERFTFYFKEKFADILLVEEMKKASSLTISPLLFEKSLITASPEEEIIQNFISDTPIQKLFLSVNGEDTGLTLQEFKCLAWLSRGKTVKEIGRILRLSPRTVESYIENIKYKIRVGSRSQLIDIFDLNFYNDKFLLKCLENKHERET
jgi:DNA-binding CsgD family transcriptional regulator